MKPARYIVPLSLYVLAVAPAGWCAAPARNLVRNSDFERSFSGDGPADGWSSVRTAPGGSSERVRTGGIDGGACHRIVVPPSAPVEWYVCRQVVRGLRAGDRGVMSAYLRTVGVAGGHGAYIGLNYFDSTGTRITWTDSAQSLTGTSAWERVSQPFVVPPGAGRCELNLVLHGQGTAYYDRAQVELGEQLTPWSSRDGATGAPPRSGATSRVAIFSDDIPPDGTPSDPARLALLARAAGYSAALINAAQMADPAVLTVETFDVLVLPYGGAFPAEAADNLRAFMEEGGRLLSVGGYPLDRPMVRTSAGWRKAADVEPDPSGLRVVLDPGASPAGWTVGGRDMPDRQATQLDDGGTGCVAFGTASMPQYGWVTLGSPALTGLPADARTLVFRARATEDGLPVAVEVTERDGARWRGVVTLTAKWRLFDLDLATLEYWKDNPSVGRGGPGDRVRLADAVAIRFGITTEFSQAGKPYEAHVSGIWTSQHPVSPWKSLRMNSATGGVNPATFLEPDPSAISICDVGAPMSCVDRICASPGVSDLQGPGALTGDVSGWSATGQTAFGGPGSPLKARWSPLADAVDRYGRKRGTAFAIMWNFAGDYPGSAWAYSGMKGRDIFAAGGRFGETLFRSALARLARGAFLYDAQATPACARPGEAIAARARVGSLSRESRRAVVRLDVRCSGKVLARRTRTIVLPARSSAPIAFELLAPRDAPNGLLKLRFSVEAPGSPPDTLACGAALWSPARQARGARIAYRNCQLDRGRGPEFLLGTQIYWGNGTITGTDPLRWSEQLAAMADNGIGVTRSFMNVPGGETEQAWRSRDAMVQLAQEAGIGLFYEGISWPPTDPAEIAKRAEPGRLAAVRYRSAPGWFVDIRNEPTIPATAAGTVANRTMADLMRRWATETRAAIRSADPSRLVTVGYLQGIGSDAVTWDPVVGSRDLDFTDRHYYGALDAYAADLKQVDMRLIGKAPSTGEFGCTSHPGLRTHFVYETEADAQVRYGYTPHACFGLGGVFCSNWHWQDPIEDIFPCGLLLADGAPRDRLQPYRNCGALFRAIRPRYETPSVWYVIPNSRFGPRRQAVEAAMESAMRALLGLHVEFGVVSEDDQAHLPADAKAVIWPVDGTGDTSSVCGAELRVAAGTMAAEAVRQNIAQFLAERGAKRHALLPDAAGLQSFRVAGEDGAVAHVLFNTTNAPMQATLSDLPKPVAIHLGPRSGGCAIFDGKGRLVAAEGKRVTVAGQRILDSDATVGLVSKDGADLLASARVLLLPFGPGVVRLYGTAARLTASVGEVRGGRWTEYQRVTPSAGALRLDAAMARSWIVLGRPGALIGLNASER